MTNSHRSLVSRAALCVAVVSTLLVRFHAQDACAQIPMISGGTHVRIEAQPTGEKITGTVFSQNADSIAIAAGGVVRVLPLESIARMQVSSGRSHAHGAYRGMQLGALIVGGAGAVISSYASYDGPKRPSDLLGFVAASAFTGAFYGAIIGAAVGAESWTPVYNSRVSVAVRHPSGAATRMGVSLRL